MNGGLVQRLAELNLIRDPATVGTKTLVITRPRQHPVHQGESLGLVARPSVHRDESPAPVTKLSPHQDDGDTDQETDRLLGQQRSDDPGFYDEKGWRRPKTRTVMPRAANHKANGGGATSNGSTPSTPIGQNQQVSTNQTPSSPPDMPSTNKNKNKKEKEANKKKGRSKEVMIHEPAVLIEGVLFRARYLGSTQLVSEGQPTKTTRMMQAEEAVSRIKDADDDKEALAECNDPEPSPGPPHSPSPKHSPLPHHSPTSLHSSRESDSPNGFDSPRELSPRGQNSPRNLNSPRGPKSRSLASPMAQESLAVSPRVVHSPRRGHGYPHTPDNQPVHNTSWKPLHRMNQGVPACPYMAEVNMVHSNVPLVAPLPPGMLEEPIDTQDDMITVIEPREEPLNVIGDDDDYEEEEEEEEVEEEEEEDEEEEEEDEREEQRKVIRAEDEEEEDDDEEEEDDDDDDEDEDDDGEGGKNVSLDSEDQCIEVLTVIPGTSGTTQENREEELEVDGGGGNLDWVSEEGGGPGLGPAGTVFHLRLVGSVDVAEESGKAPARKTTTCKRPKKDMVMEAVSHLKALAPDGESQPSTEVDLFISTEKIMVLNTDLKEIMMDHALRTISYIADIGDLVVLMARRRVLPTDDAGNNIQKAPKMICHVFESDEAQFIAQSIGQAFQVAYLEFLKANGIEDHSFVKEMDYQEVLNSQEIFGDELQMFAKKELQKEVVVPKMKSEILGVVVVESGWGSMVPTVVIANLSPTGAAAKCGQLNIGDQIIAINGVSLVGLPLSTCQNYIKNTKYNTAVKLTVVPCPPVVEVKIRRPDTKYQLGFSVQNGVICSLLRGGIAERGGVRVGHRIIDINSQSVVAVPHEKIVNLLATSVGEIRMKTMPTSIFRLLTGQETPQYI
ncbi:amyloid-beta A4 precursor protein-binding family A member 2-like isoform X3 [Homarus americanus]|uniref:amyloid-beta A4 precursor protein-binding family A member 2-like isoform X3 n=1 Tax=Homarus americanus TaxID=6706 RepID=UPI001C47747C|nr:amyloid-beta A4 precursor protein-binding family A member 2-like isoform X3 [Homarus americanus]